MGYPAVVGNIGHRRRRGPRGPMNVDENIQSPSQRTVIDNSKHRSTMQDYQVRCTVAAMLYVGGQVKSYEEALKIADNMLNASRQYGN